MCLAVPVQIKSIEGNEAEAEIGGISRRISLWLTPEAKVGDYVLEIGRASCRERVYVTV